MFLGYGIAIAIIIEWWRRRKDRFKDPSASWMTDFIRDELMPVEESKLSAEAKYERFLKRYNRQWRDQYGSDSHYRLITIANLVELYISQRRYYEARGWQNLAIQILEFNKIGDEKLASAYDKLAELEMHMGRVNEASFAYRKAAIIYRTLRNFKSLSVNLSVHFDAVANRYKDDEALAISDELLEVLETLHGPTAIQIENHLLHAETTLGREKLPAPRRQFLKLLMGLHISEEALGKDHAAVAGDLTRLATFFSARGKVTAAADLSERARMIRLLNKVDGVDYPGIERDLVVVAEWLELRNQDADCTVAFHMRKRAERIAEKRISKSKR
jgi:tetratricopeptide (TPR) repeat protein